MSKRPGGVSWIKKEEPKFIRQFKERIAYKEQATSQTKVSDLIIIKMTSSAWSIKKPHVYSKKKKLDNDLLVEREEDLPQVVQLKSGDLGQKEYLELKSKEDIESKIRFPLYDKLGRIRPFQQLKSVFKNARTFLMCFFHRKNCVAFQWANTAFKSLLRLSLKFLFL